MTNKATFNMHQHAEVPFRTSEGLASNRPRFLRAYPLWCDYALMAVAILVVIPVAYFPGTNLNYSAPFAIAILLEIFLVRPRFLKTMNWLLAPAILFIIATVVSNLHSLFFGPNQPIIKGILLALRYIYWPAIMVAIALVVAFSYNIRKYILVIGWSVVALSALRLGTMIMAGGARPSVLGLSPNDYGFLFSSFSFVGLCFPLILKNKWVGILCAILCALAIFADASRGNWVSICVAALVLSWMLRSQLKNLFLFIAILAFLGVIIYFLFTHMSGESGNLISQKVGSFENLNADASYMTRKAMQRKAWALFLENPYLGIGPGNFKRVEADFVLPKRLRSKSFSMMNSRSAHNGYAQLLAEQGVCGAIPFAVILFMLFNRGWKSCNKARKSNRLIPQIIFACALAASIHLWAISGMTGTQIWLVYGLLAGVSSRSAVIKMGEAGPARIVKH